ncbi:tRNA (adenine(22)-N(1))-methyltransferase TrmK, partial [Bacillus vallismortis]|nr:tRNA (adenine(22)-N(1))-methyltransferase TrmK [Bacillus vallismortis]
EDGKLEEVLDADAVERDAAKAVISLSAGKLDGTFLDKEKNAVFMKKRKQDLQPTQGSKDQINRYKETDQKKKTIA